MGREVVICVVKLVWNVRNPSGESLTCNVSSFFIEWQFPCVVCENNLYMAAAAVLINCG